MPIPAIPSIVTAGLFRLGYKVAQKQSWLPEFVYHQLSVKKLKEGDLDQARAFNAVAVRKKPNSIKAQVMQDILSMHHDSSIAKMEGWIGQERTELLKLKTLADNTDYVLKKSKMQGRASKVLLVFALAAFAVLVAIWAMHERTLAFYIVFIAGLIVIAGLSVYYRFFAVNSETERILSRQEQEALASSVRREIAARNLKLQRLQNELNELIEQYHAKDQK